MFKISHVVSHKLEETRHSFIAARSSLYSKVTTAFAVAMKQISLLLLLLTGIAGAHENDDIDSDQHSFGEFMMTGSGDEHDEHNDHDDTQEVRVKWSTDVVLNALMAFGINDTAFRPGQIICPSSNLGSSYKESKVTVGVVGCKLDPLISHYTPQQRKLLQGYHDDDIYESLNCTDTINIAGYFPPVPGTYYKCDYCMHTCIVLHLA